MHALLVVVVTPPLTLSLNDRVFTDDIEPKENMSGGNAKERRESVRGGGAPAQDPNPQ